MKAGDEHTRNQNPVDRPTDGVAPQHLSGPADIVLIVDVSGSMKDFLDPLIRELPLFLKGLLGAGDTGTSADMGQARRRVGIVGHRASFEGDITLFALDPVDDSQEDRVREAVVRLRGSLGANEASLHAIDWAMDNIGWGEGHRRVLAVFTDERVGGGDLVGVNASSAEKFLAKLSSFDFFLVGPVSVDDRPPIGFHHLSRLPTCRGTREIQHRRDWARLDIGRLGEEIARAVDVLPLPGTGSTAIPRDVFGGTSRRVDVQSL